MGKLVVLPSDCQPRAVYVQNAQPKRKRKAGATTPVPVGVGVHTDDSVAIYDPTQSSGVHPQGRRKASSVSQNADHADHADYGLCHGVAPFSAAVGPPPMHKQHSTATTMSTTSSGSSGSSGSLGSSSSRRSSASLSVTRIGMSGFFENRKDAASTPSWTHRRTTSSKPGISLGGVRKRAS